MTYTPFWETIKNFQSLIGATINLLAIAGAIFGIVLKAKLDQRALDRKARESRRTTAATICSLLATENRFPTISLLRIPSESDVSIMLKNPIGTSLGANNYISYLANITATLAEYPPAIAERASFVSWVSTRILIAVAQIANAPTAERDKLADASAKEIRFLIASAVQVIDELDSELGTYRKIPELYEEQWEESPDAKKWSFISYYGSFSSDKLDLAELREKVWLNTLKDQKAK